MRKPFFDHLVDTSSSHPRSMQIVAALPSLLLWTFVAGRASVWCVGAGIMAFLGRLPVGDWRVPYLAIVCLMALACSCAVAFTLVRAFQGHSRLGGHALTFGLGLVFFVLLGIVGD